MPKGIDDQTQFLLFHNCIDALYFNRKATKSNIIWDQDKK